MRPDGPTGQWCRHDAIRGYRGSGGSHRRRWPRLYCRRFSMPVCSAKIQIPAEIVAHPVFAYFFPLRLGNRDRHPDQAAPSPAPALGGQPPNPRHFPLWANSMVARGATTPSNPCREGILPTRRPLPEATGGRYGTAAILPCHAIGVKRKMPGVRGQRPRGGAVFQPQVRENRMSHNS